MNTATVHGKRFRIGVDVGGTNTDSIVLHPGEAKEPHRGIRSSFKTPTTSDVTEGISVAIDGALKRACIDRNHVSAVMIGTTVSRYNLLLPVSGRFERHIFEDYVAKPCV